MAFDLLIKGGQVLDPGQNLNGKWDIGVTAGRIAAIEPDIPTTDARRVIQVKGDNRYITPGLIDIHTHVAYGATTAGVGMGCCNPDQIGVRAGVTTVLDCGSVGVANIGVLAAHVIPGAKTRVIPFLEKTFTGDNALVPVLTVRAGEVFEPEWGPHPWGWLPEEA